LGNCQLTTFSAGTTIAHHVYFDLAAQRLTYLASTERSQRMTMAIPETY
jgi:hypothetical protein